MKKHDPHADGWGAFLAADSFVQRAMGPGPLESERLLDDAIECSVPASDPIAVQDAFDAACEREHRQACDVNDG
jgi:hypothetical protein